MTRKQMLLRTMFAYLSHKTLAHNNLTFSFYGTTCFHLVWEEICNQVFPNALHKPLSKLDVPLTVGFENRSSETLQNLIAKPLWRMKYKGEFCDIPARKTLIPDIIHIARIDSGFAFCIIDAKYYDIFDSSKPIKTIRVFRYLKGTPIKWPITLLSQSIAYRQERLCFSSRCSSFEVSGEVQMPFFEHVHTKPDLVNIEVIKVPARHLYDCYLKGGVESINSIFPDL